MGQTLFKIRIFFISVFGFFGSSLFLVVLFPFLFAFWFYSKFVYFLVWLKLRENFTRPAGLDIIQGIESERSRPFINAIGRFIGTFDLERCCARFEQDLLKHRNERGNFVFRKFTQVFEEMYGYHIFRDTQEAFDIKNQIRVVEIRDVFPELFDSSDGSKKSSILEGKGEGEERVLQIKWEILVERLMDKFGSNPTPPGCPQWEILILQEEKNYTFLFRIHHSFCDGIYFVRFLLEHFADTPLDSSSLPYVYHQPNVIRRGLDYLWAFCLLPYAMYRFSFTYEKNPLHGPQLSGKKMFVMSERIPLATLKEIKRSTKTSMNAVLFTCLSNAFASHFTSKKSTAQSLITLLPVSLHDLGRPIKFKNRFSLIGIMLPTFLDKNISPEGAALGSPNRTCTSAIARLRQVQASCWKSVRDPSFLAIHWLLVLICTLLPTSLLRALFRTNGFTISMSNVAGPPKEEFYFLDGRKTEFMFWIPDRSPLGMGVSVAGFAGRVRIGLMVDQTLMKTKREGYTFLENFVREIHCLHKETKSDSSTEDEMAALIDSSSGSFLQSLVMTEPVRLPTLPQEEEEGEECEKMKIIP